MTLYQTKMLRHLEVGEWFGYGSTRAVVVEPWHDREIAYRLEDREDVYHLVLDGTVLVDVELVPGTPDYYRAKLAAMTDAEALRAFEAVISQLAGTDIGHPNWDTTREMAAIARAEISARLGIVR